MEMNECTQSSPVSPYFEKLTNSAGNLTIGQFNTADCSGTPVYTCNVSFKHSHIFISTYLATSFNNVCTKYLNDVYYRVYHMKGVVVSSSLISQTLTSTFAKPTEYSKSSSLADVVVSTPIILFAAAALFF